MTFSQVRQGQEGLQNLLLLPDVRIQERRHRERLMGEAYRKSSQTYLLHPFFLSLSVCFYLSLITPSQSCCLPSSQMCHINSTAAVPINVHRHSLRTLIFSFFSLHHCACVCESVCVCVFEGEVQQLLALHFLVKL